ncbi:hypothetical protein CTI12_AA166880 [Artemisia annua]|uniref:Uncharacterized protein n=1 Tax=Artemisia annua TaxID=35608 RepID=A0A2U1PCX3_ARTAN|nr:hypothetical protein CTI12_AA166880 [Artemisia annua]
MDTVVQQDVSAATTNQVSTAEVSTAEEVAKTVDEAEIANFMDEKRRSKVSEVETDEQARVAKLYKDKTLTNDDRVQRLADLINARSEEVELADLINSRSEEVALNELIQPIKQAQSQKRKKSHKGSAHE